MKISKIIGVSAMVMLLATLMVSVASASGGSSYANAQSITVPDRDVTIYGYYGADPKDWWKFSANVGDRIYIDLDYTFTQKGGTEYLHDTKEGDIQASIICAGCYPNKNDNYAWLVGTTPRLEITKGSGSYNTYEHVVSRNYY